MGIVTTSFEEGGGVPYIAAFLYRQLKKSDEYTPRLISVPMGASSEIGVRVLSPSSWLRGIQVTEEVENDISFRKVGAFLSEFEFQRYRPRPTLTEELEECDLIQVVAGTPSWAHLAKNVSVPVALQVATLTHVERDGRHDGEPFPLRLWRGAMTNIATWIEKQAPSIVDVIFVENQWMYDHYRQHHPEVDVHFAPPGVDTSLYRSGTGEGKEDDYILSVGRFSDPRKNVELLFEAYARLRRDLSDPPRLVLAGLDGPSDSAWETATSLGIAEHVDVHVEVPDEELARLYRNAGLFVLPSKEEGLGIVIAEAMASGVPVVSTDCGGPSTLIQEGETGYLVPVGDSEAMAEQMKAVLANPHHAQELGRRGRERIEKHFSEEAAGRKFLEVYAQLLE